MKLKRKLTDKEIEISRKNIDKLRKRNFQLNYFKNLLEMDIQKILYKLSNDNYKIEIDLKLDGLNKERDQIEREINENQEIIKKTEEQFEKPNYTG